MGTSASSSRLTDEERAKVAHLMSMGFEESPSLHALRQAEGDVNRAVEMLVNGGGASSSNGAGQTTARSMEAEMRRQRAAEAAQRRFDNNPLSKLRASVGGKKKPQQYRQQQEQQPSRNPFAIRAPKPKSFEEQLEECCDRLCQFPKALDLLIYVLNTILKNPGEKKYREIKMTNKRFKETIGQSNGFGVVLLKLVGFSPAGDWYVLRGNEDSAKLWMAVEVMEKRKENPVYIMETEKLAFEKAMMESLNSANEEELTRREQFTSKVPVEPDLGIAGTTRITVFCGDNVWQRRFNADDVLESIIMWLGATHSSLIPGNLDDGIWELVDKTLYPHRVIDVVAQKNLTLQSAKLWPSADLLIQPAGTLEIERRARERDANATD